MHYCCMIANPFQLIQFWLIVLVRLRRRWWSRKWSAVCIIFTCRCVAVSAVLETGVAMILTLLVLDPRGMGALRYQSLVFHSYWGEKDDWTLIPLLVCINFVLRKNTNCYLFHCTFRIVDFLFMLCGNSHRLLPNILQSFPGLCAHHSLHLWGGLPLVSF